MKYNFDEIINRQNCNSLKWDIKEGELPMWVADMDFKVCPEILEAIHKKIDVGALGYSIIPEEWYKSYISFWKERYSFNIDKSWLCFVTGVIPAISTAVRRFTDVGDNIVCLTPVYNIFFHSIENNKRNTIECPLIYKDYKYSINFEILEEIFKLEKTKMLILCNPHNPIGKIWSKEELIKIADLAKKYEVVVLSDEIHGPLTDPDKNYIPFASTCQNAQDISITAISCSKAFNLAGLQSAAVIVPNSTLRNIMFKGINDDEVGEPNIIAMEGTIAAFNKGPQWLDELRQYIYDNKMLVKQFLNKKLPKFKLIESEATYLLWIDITRTGKKSDELQKDIRDKTGLYLSGGTQYRGNGYNFLRMNIAMPRVLVQDGLDRLNEYFKKYGK